MILIKNKDSYDLFWRSAIWDTAGAIVFQELIQAQMSINRMKKMQNKTQKLYFFFSDSKPAPNLTR